MCSESKIAKVIAAMSLALGLAIATPAPVLADVRCVQAFLAETAFDPGPVDGLWGRKTAAALEEAFGQLGQNVDGGLVRNNTDRICEIVSGPEGERIAANLAFRVYPISIDPDRILDLNPVAFDFSDVAIALDVNTSCSFEVWRIRPSEDEAWVYATGRAVIENGFLRVIQNAWRVGGFAENNDLIENSNIVMTESGMLVGRMMFFPLYVNRGEVAVPPVFVTLGDSFERRGDSPTDGSTYFVVDDWNEGKVHLSCQS